MGWGYRLSVCVCRGGGVCVCVVGRSDVRLAGLVCVKVFEFEGSSYF